MSAMTVPDCENCALREGCPRRTPGNFCTSWVTDPANDPRILAQRPKPWEDDPEAWDL